LIVTSFSFAVHSLRHTKNTSPIKKNGLFFHDRNAFEFDPARSARETSPASHAVSEYHSEAQPKNLIFGKPLGNADASLALSMTSK
jgi:hypothetical protein